MNNEKMMLGTLEQKVMDHLWTSKQTSCRELHEQLNKEVKKKLAYTTLMTVMDRLYHNGFLSRKKVGKTYLYTCKKSREQTLKAFAENMINALVNKFGTDAIVAFSQGIDNISHKQDEPRI